MLDSVRRRCKILVVRPSITGSKALATLLVGGLVLYFIWWSFVSGGVLYSHKKNAVNMAALEKIHQELALGMPYNDVLSSYWGHRTGDLRLFADRASDWKIGMPLEFGAADWKLLIEFQKGVVSAVRLRTSDGPSPKGGPEDKVANRNRPADLPDHVSDRR